MTSVEDEDGEHQAIKVGSLQLISIYLSPTSSCSIISEIEINKYLLEEDAIVKGLFNARDSLWFSAIDTKGSKLADEISSTNFGFGVLNEDYPTQFPRNGLPTFRI